MAHRLYIVAGGNGSGKSTFIKTYIEPNGLFYLCADEIAMGQNLPLTKEGALTASLTAQSQFEQLLKKGDDFCYETVFSHSSKIDLIREAKAAGYEVHLVYIHLADTSLNVARVRQRVDTGGHDVPEDKIISRPPRTLTLMSQAINLVDEFWALDNSEAGDDGFKSVFKIWDGRLSIADETETPPWAAILLKNWKP